MHRWSLGSLKSTVPDISACMDAPPSSSASVFCPMAACTNEGPARNRPEPSVMRMVSVMTGRYAPPATHIPMMAVICGIPSELMTALLRKTRPKSSVSGKTSSCKGRKTPDESTRYRVGMRFSRAMVCARRTFFAVMGKKAPALTVASLAMIMQSRPETRPSPVTTPAPGAPPYSPYIPYAAQRPSSNSSVFSSSSSFRRSRTVSRPLARCASAA